MSQIAQQAIIVFNGIVLIYFVVLQATYSVVTVAALSTMFRSLRRHDDAGREDMFANPLTPPVSILVPAFNEEAGIIESVRSLLALRYPLFEVIVVDDGSTDRTFAVLERAFDLREVVPTMDTEIPTLGAVRSMHVPSRGEALTVIRKVNAGRRADALNVAINAARHPLICMIDADSILEPDALLRVAQPFVDDPLNVVASGGVIRAANGTTVYRGGVVANGQPKRWIERIQSIEYLRSFLVGRTGWSRMSGLLIISGAFGLFRRDVVVEVGGMDPESLGEDADLVATLHRHLRDQKRKYSVVFVPEPVCWTELPATRSMLARQRTRWSRGLAQVLWKQRRMMLNPRYGRIGMIVLPYYLAFELLGPVVELLGVLGVIAGIGFGLVDISFVVLLGLVALAWGLVLSFAAIAFDEFTRHRNATWRDLAISAMAAIAENLGYRQLHAWWRFCGLLRAVTRRDAAWGAMARTGFTTEG